MSEYSESYEVGESEAFEESFDADEARFRPGKRISVPGAGLASATLLTPKGAAQLKLPAAVPTHTQFRQLESALNSQTQRLNAVQAELVKVRRELVIRRREQQGQGSSGMMGMLMPLLLQKKIRDDLEGHTHATSGAAIIPAGSGGGFSSLLPLLLLSPGMFGGSAPSGSATASYGGTDSNAMSPLLMLLLFADL